MSMRTEFPHPRRRTKLATAYVGFLAIMAMLATAYLGVLFIKPDVLTAWLPHPGSPIETGSTEPVFDSEAEIAALRTTVNQLSADLARAKADIETLGYNDRAIEGNVAALERKFAVASRALEERLAATAEKGAVAAAEPPPGMIISQQTQAKAPTQQRIQETPAAPAGKTPKIINSPAPKAEAKATPAQAPVQKATPPAAKKQQPIETGSVEGTAKSAQASAPAETAIKPAARPYGLMITKAPSVDALRLYWGLVSDQHGGDLNGLNPRYVASGDSANPAYDLVAGPLPSKAEAKRKCKALSEKGLSCTVTDYTGNAL